MKASACKGFGWPGEARLCVGALLCDSSDWIENEFTSLKIDSEDLLLDEIELLSLLE